MYTVDELQKLVESEIKKRSEDLLKNTPVELYKPIEYSLDMGGKRLRPVLLLLAYNLFSEKLHNALPAAVAVEVFHNFTLLHDDIMDKARVRRNRPTVHIQFDENSAILSGDAMAFQSYKYLLECKSEQLAEVLELFTTTAIEVCEGQQYDMDFENRMDVAAVEYLEMIRLKTAVLLACSLKAGAMLGGAPAILAEQLYSFGENLGLAFQLQDDMLDTFGNQKTFGKRIGGDILANKKTYLLIKALENADFKLKEELISWIEAETFDQEEKIERVTQIYRMAGAKELTEERVEYYFNSAMKILGDIELKPAAKQSIQDLAMKMLVRKQ